MSHSSSPNGTDNVFATVVHGPMWKKSHMSCMWDPFWSLWATHNGHMVLNAREPVFERVANNKGADQPAFLLV